MTVKRKDFQKIAALIHEFLLKLSEGVDCSELRDAFNYTLLQLQRYYRILRSRSSSKHSNTDSGTAALATLGGPCRSHSPGILASDAADKFEWKWVELDTNNLSTTSGSLKSSRDSLRLPVILRSTKQGNSGFILQLLEQDIESMTEVDTLGRNCLMYAVHFRQLDTLQILLENGSDINHRAHDGMTAVQQACSEGNDEAVEMLMHYGADVNAIDELGRTALHWACTLDSTRCLQLLLDNNVDVGLHDNDGMSALMWCCHGDRLPHLRLLLNQVCRQLGDDRISEQDVSGKSWLHWCVRRTEPMKCLQDVLTGELVARTATDGKALVHTAAELGSLSAMKVIVQKTGKRYLEDRDMSNRTPLILATMGGHGELVNYLLSHSADLSCTDNAGCTAWDYAGMRQLHYCMLIIASYLRQRNKGSQSHRDFTTTGGGRQSLTFLDSQHLQFGSGELDNVGTLSLTIPHPPPDPPTAASTPRTPRLARTHAYANQAAGQSQAASRQSHAGDAAGHARGASAIGQEQSRRAELDRGDRSAKLSAGGNHPIRYSSAEQPGSSSGAGQQSGQSVMRQPTKVSRPPVSSGRDRAASETNCDDVDDAYNTRPQTDPQSSHAPGFAPRNSVNVSTEGPALKSTPGQPHARQSNAGNLNRGHDSRPIAAAADDDIDVTQLVSSSSLSDDNMVAGQGPHRYIKTQNRPQYRQSGPHAAASVGTAAYQYNSDSDSIDANSPAQTRSANVLPVHSMTPPAYQQPGRPKKQCGSKAARNYDDDDVDDEDQYHRQGRPPAEARQHHGSRPPSQAPERQSPRTSLNSSRSTPSPVVPKHLTPLTPASTRKNRNKPSPDGPTPEAVTQQQRQREIWVRSPSPATAGQRPQAMRQRSPSPAVPSTPRSERSREGDSPSPTYKGQRSFSRGQGLHNADSPAVFARRSASSSAVQRRQSAQHQQLNDELSEDDEDVDRRHGNMMLTAHNVAAAAAAAASDSSGLHPGSRSSSRQGQKYTTAGTPSAHPDTLPPNRQSVVGSEVRRPHQLSALMPPSAGLPHRQVPAPTVSNVLQARTRQQPLRAGHGVPQYRPQAAQRH